MKLQIGAGPSLPTDDPIALLLDCHVRIRHFTALATTLAGAGEAPVAHRVDAANGLCRYFGIAFPLHGTDEEELLVPVLRESMNAEVLKAVEAVPGDHRTADALLEALLPTWRAIADSPDGGPALLERLADPSARLQSHLAEHLIVEETLLFPEARRLLGPAEARGLREAMAQKRLGVR